MDLGRIKKKLEEGLQGVGSFIGGLGRGIQQGVGQITQGIRNVVSQPQQPQIQQPQISTFRQPGIQPTVQPAIDFKSTFKAPGAPQTQQFDIGKLSTPSLVTSPTKAIETVKLEAPKAVVKPTTNAVADYYKKTALSQGVENIRDVFDANTQADIQKRLAAGQPADYRTQQIELFKQSGGREGSLRPYQNIGGALAGNTARYINTAAAASKELQDTVNIGILQAIGADDLANKLIEQNAKFKQTMYQPNSGLFGQGTIFNNPEEFGKLGAGELTSRVAAVTGGTALEVAPFTKGAGLAGTATYKALSPAQRIAARTTVGAAENALQDIAEQKFTYGGQIRPEQTLAATGLGSVAPNIGPIASGIRNRAFSTGAQQVAVPGVRQTITPPTRAVTPEPIRVSTQAPAQVPVAKTARQEVPASASPTVNTITENIAAVDAAKKGAEQGIFKRIYGVVKREGFDPKYYLQSLDDKFAKSIGANKEQLDARSLINTSRAIDGSGQEAQVILTSPTSTGRSIAEVMDRNIGKNDGKDFVEYLNQKFILEIYEKSGNNPRMWKLQGFTPDQVRATLAAYEAADPQAIVDARTIKAWADQMLDIGVAKGEITQEFANIIKNRYQNYVPLDRVFREDRVVPKVSGGMGSVAEQNVVRFLGEGAASYDNTFNPIIQRTNQIISRGNQNKLNIELFLRAKENKLPGVTIEIDPAKVAAREAAVSEMQQIRQVINQLKSTRGRSTTQVRNLRLQLQQATNTAAERARQYLIEQATDAKGANFARRLKQNELLEMFDLINDTNAAKVNGIANRLAKKGDDYQSALIKLQQVREDIASLSDEASRLYGLSAQLNQKIETGQNIIKGYINGQQFALRIEDPQLVKQLAYLKELNNPQGAMGVVARGSAAIAAPQKVVATGALAPVFAAKTFFRNMILKYTNVERASAFGVRPLTIGYFGGLTRKGDVFDKLVGAGFTPPGFTKGAFDQKRTAKEIASRASAMARFKYVAKTPREWWRTLDNFAGSLDVADRVQIGYGVYLRNISKGASEETAWLRAAKAANEALGDFKRTSELARAAEAVVPYSGATQAGYRALVRRFRVAPVETTIKMASILAPITALTAYQADKYRDYYEDLINDGRTSELDTNIVILNPLSTKDPETGNWVNLTKIPVAPDYKPLVRAAWKTGFGITSGQGVDVGMLSKEMGNFLTANQLEGIVGDPQFTSGTGRVLPSSPAKTNIMIALGLNPRTGKPLADEYLAGKPRTEQFTDYTSENAKRFSQIMLGILTPQQLDALADQGGLVGDIIQSGGEKPSAGDVVSTAFKTAFIETKARTPEKIASQQYFKDIDEIGKQFVDKKQFRLWQALRSARTNKLGEKTDSTLLDSAQKALEFLNNNELLSAEIELNRRSGDRAGLVNPLFDQTLNDEQRRRVLTYRSMRINNAAKQNYTKNGESAFISLGLDEPWYKDFQKKEKAYWEEVAKKGDKDPDKSVKTFSGKPAIEPSPQLEAKLDFYYTLPKNTGQRSAFLKANPDIINYWDQQNDFTNEERAALGFKPLEEDEGGFGGKGKKQYARRVGQPLISSRFQKPGGLAVPRAGGIRALRPGGVVVKRTQA